LRNLIDYLQRNALISTLNEIELVVHQVPHGGKYRGAMPVDDALIAELRHFSQNQVAALDALHACLHQLPCWHVAVFDNSFTSTLPDETATYALPKRIRHQIGRRTGHHGLVHKGAYLAACKLVKRKSKRVISIHIDEQVSVLALLDGVAIDGGEALPGLHNAGAIDPLLALHLQQSLRSTPQQIAKLLQHRSGLASLSGKKGYSEMVAAARQGERESVEALLVLTARIAQAAAGVTAALGGVDMIIFSGSGALPSIRQDICERLSYLGVRAPSTNRMTGVLAKGRRLVVAVQVRHEDLLLQEAMQVFRQLS
jgi:acetate kinase